MFLPSMLKTIVHSNFVLFELQCSESLIEKCDYVTDVFDWLFDGKVLFMLDSLGCELRSKRSRRLKSAQERQVQRKPILASHSRSFDDEVV